MKKVPKLCHHKRHSLAYVTVGGKQKYLGKWGNQESEAVYGQFLVQWSKEQDEFDYAAAEKPRKFLLIELVE